MRYIIIPKDSAPFMTEWFEPDNHYQPGMVVINTHIHHYYAGDMWHPLNFDYL